MKQYLDALRFIMDNGVDKSDRTGTGTRSIFGYQMRFNMADGFPAMTTKKLAWKSVLSELLWFIEGSGDERRLAEILYSKPREQLKDKTTIWTANLKADYWKDKARFEGDLGKVYGVQWRHAAFYTHSGKHKVIDQLDRCIEGIKKDPDGRRHIITAWNINDLDDMALPPCHIMMQFYVAGKKLSLQMMQRSNDVFLGVPFNIASYSLLLHMVAQVCGLEAHEFIHVAGDFHIYQNHFEQVKEQLAREPRPLPKLKMNTEIKDINQFTMKDFELVDYNPYATIKAEMAV